MIAREQEDFDNLHEAEFTDTVVKKQIEKKIKSMKKITMMDAIMGHDNETEMAMFGIENRKTVRSPKPMRRATNSPH